MTPAALSEARRASASELLGWAVVSSAPAARRRDDVPVWRVSGSGGRTAIVKAFAETWPAADDIAADRAAWFASESAALKFFTDRGCAVSPRFVGADARRGIVVMEDLGEHPDVASILLGDAAAAALDALCAWADALADLHVAGAGRTREYETARARGGASSRLFAVEDSPSAIESAVRASYDPGFVLPAGLARVVTGLQRDLGSPRWQVVSPADSCPDNNVVLPDGTVRLFDFQFASARHALLDVAYLHTVMPTCWCVRRLPAGVAGLATERYRRRAAKGLAGVRDDKGFADALRAARAALALSTLGWVLRRAARDDGGSGETMGAYGFRTCSPRQIAELRLADLETVAGEEPGLTPLGELAAAIRRAVAERFGAVDPVPLYPAFGGPR